MYHVSTPHVLWEEKDYFCYLKVEMGTGYYGFRAHKRHSLESVSDFLREIPTAHVGHLKHLHGKKKTTPKCSIITTDIYVG